MSIWEKAAELNESFVQITLTNVRGGAPQDIGAKCLVTKRWSCVWNYWRWKK